MIGLMCAGLNKPHTFMPEHVDIFKKITPAISIALQHIRNDDAMKKRQKELKEISTQLVVAQEEERKRISRELHDVMGQTLIGIDMDLANAERDLSQGINKGIETWLSEARSLISEISDNIDTIAMELRPIMLDELGLVPTLRWYIDSYCQRTNINVSLKLEGMDRKLSPEMETHLFRIVQEALTNVVKHAEARKVTISMKCEGLEFLVLIEDDGIGFDMMEIEGRLGQKESNFGILGIRERVLAIDGQLDIYSNLGEGIKLSMTIPL